jgi:cell wall-associated NlpC family hydrolase
MILGLYALVVSCASLGGVGGGLAPLAAVANQAQPLAATTTASATAATAAGGITPIQQALVRAAHDLIGVDELYIGGQHYLFDCSGTVMAIYASAGLNLGRHFERYTGNGVSRIHQMVEEYGKLVAKDPGDLPAPGDIVFFDDTYDKNGDGAWNDALTHTGMVVAVSPAGTVQYVHNHYRLGIVIEQMNLARPDIHYERIDGVDVKVNAPMRMRGTGGGPGRWLASHLTRDFGRAFEIPL